MTISSDTPNDQAPADQDQSVLRGIAARERFQRGAVTAAACLAILVLSYLILVEMAVILRPLLIAVFICYLIVPAHRCLVRCHVPSLISYVLIVGAVMSVTFFVGRLVVESVAELSAELPSYVRQFESYVDRTAEDIKRSLRERSARRTTAPPAGESDFEATSTATAPAVPSQPREAWKLLSQQRLIALGRTMLEASLSIFSLGLIVLLYTLFLLAELSGFRGRVISAFGAARAESVVAVVRQINAAVSRYIVVKTFVSLLVAALSFGVLLLFGVRYAFVWGVLTFFANFIPYVGSFVAAALPISMSVVQFESLGKPATIAALLIVAQVSVGSILEPRMIGKRLGVSPLIILLSLAFWGQIWGIPGMVLSAPLAVTAVIVLGHLESTRPIARLCGSK